MAVNIETIDPSTTPFPEFFLKVIAKDGALSSRFKCIAVSVLLYLPGLIIAFLSGIIEVFLRTSFGLLSSSIIVGATLILLLRFFRKMVDAISELNEITCPDKEKLEAFVRWTQENDSPYWYYFDAFVMAIIAVLFSNFVVLPGPHCPPWTLSSLWLRVFFVLWYGVVAFIAGVLICRIFNSVWVIRRYCKEFLTPKQITPFNPDKRGGLKALGDLLLSLDVAVALPILVILVFAMDSAIKLEKVAPIWSDPFLVFVIISYTIVLTIVFFAPLAPAHNAMVIARNQALKNVRESFRDFQQKASKENRTIASSDLESLQKMCFLYQHVEGMFSWPVSFGTFLRFVATFALPIFVGIIVEIAF